MKRRKMDSDESRHDVVPIVNSDLWTCRYAPTSSVSHKNPKSEIFNINFIPSILFQSQLTISSAKLTLLRSALESSNLIIVSGPSGTSKTTAIKIISKELNFSLSVWSTTPYSVSRMGRSYIGQDSIAVRFLRFLQRRYQSQFYFNRLISYYLFFFSYSAPPSHTNINQ